MVDGGVQELPARRRRVRLVADQVQRRRVGGGRRQRHDQIAHLHVGLEPAAGADPEDLRHAELRQLLDHDPGRRTAHPARLHRDRPAAKCAREAQHAPLAVHLHWVVEERVGDVLGAERISGEQASRGVVSGLGAKVDRHRRKPTASARYKGRGTLPATIEPTLKQILRFCAEDPVERVFLEDVARRGLGRFAGLADEGRLTALCHVGANVVPAGVGCAAFARASAASRARMMIGEEAAVGELWGAARALMNAPREDRPGQPVYVIERSPDAGGTGLREATLADLGLLVPACAAAHEEEIGLNPLEADPDGFRWRTQAQINEGRSWVWIESGTILFKAEASAWTPEAVQLQQVWVDPSVRNRGNAQRAMRDLCRRLLGRVPTVCLFVRPENASAIRVYEAVGMRRTITYRSLIF